MDFKIYAVNFDGTLCENQWPNIGAPNERLIELLKKEQAAGTAKLILWTCRVDKQLENAIAWCKERGLTFDAINENLPESQEMFGGNPRKIFAHEYIDDRSGKNYGLPFHASTPGDMSSWAEHEVALACISEREGVKKPKDAEYAIVCYNSVLRAFRMLMKDGYSDPIDIQIKKSFLNRLIDGKTLTPIQDTPDIWNESPFVNKDGTKEYQCSRMSSLFKKVKPDGTVTYSDINRVNCVDINKSYVAFTNGIVREFIDKLYPITMPYLPSSKKFTIYMQNFLYDPKNGDNTIAWLYLITPDGERVEINRYFKKLAGKMVPISKEEYDQSLTAQKEGI